MKIRSGFVSNSSSSSFVAIGFEIPYHGEEWIDFCKRNFKFDVDPSNEGQYELGEEIEERTGLTFYSPNRHDVPGHMLGVQLAYGIEDGDSGNVAVDEKVVEMIKWKDEFNLDVPIKIFWGTSQS